MRVIHREGFVTVKLAQVGCWNAVRCEQALPYSCVQKARRYLMLSYLFIREVVVLWNLPLV